jgi:Tfp pilus assembly protein PilN
MRKLKLNFVSQFHFLQLFGIGLLVIACILILYLGITAVQKKKELEKLEDSWLSLQQIQKKNINISPSKMEDMKKLQTELTIANRVIAKINLPWDILFQEIETTIDSQVSLLSLEPKIEKNEVQISAEAITYHAMLDYIKRLRLSKHLKEVYLQSHQIQVQDPQKPIRFIVQLKWVSENINFQSKTP